MCCFALKHSESKAMEVNPIVVLLLLELTAFQHCKGYIWNYALDQSLSEGAYEGELYAPPPLLPRRVADRSRRAGQRGGGDDENDTRRSGEWTVRTSDSSPNPCALPVSATLHRCCWRGLANTYPNY